jgi:hypothetical protein
VQAEASQRPWEAPEQWALLDERDSHRAAAALHDVSQWCPAQSALELAPRVRLECFAEIAVNGERVPGCRLPVAGVD